MVGVGSGRRLRKWNLVKQWFLPACKGSKWHRMSHNLQFGTFYLFFSWILGNMSSAERVKKNLRLWFTKIKAMSRLWIKVVSQAWKTSSFIVSNLSCPEEKELRVLSWSSSSAIWGSDLVDPLPNYCNPESGMDIDLVRMMAAAFCFWVAWNLLGRPSGGWVEGRKLPSATWPAQGKIEVFLSLSPSPNRILLFRNHIRHLHLSVNIKVMC